MGQADRTPARVEPLHFGFRGVRGRPTYTSRNTELVKLNVFRGAHDNTRINTKYVAQSIRINITV